MDDLIRIFAFNWLEEQTGIFGDVLPRRLFEKGFEYNGQRVTQVTLAMYYIQLQ